MNDTQNRLDILLAEKKKLRANKIKQSEIHHHSIEQLQRLLGISKIRAMELRAMSEFQTIPSIGIRFAQDLISLGFYAIEELQGKDPAKLVHQLERQLGAWIDPCVEDQIRLCIHYATHANKRANWWDFTQERKAYRQQHGYPANRPTTPWYQLEQYKPANRVKAQKEITKTDLNNRLKLAIKFMKANVKRNLTLAELADKANLSPYHFQRLFKEVYERTPQQYFTRLRLKEVCKQLTKTKLSVSLIAAQVGFTDESSFIRLFKKELKQTPLAYRKNKKTLQR
ncbi:MAG: helix-turn-helix domain-containing protein [Cyclobacteriaceae bacterium]|jgi:AraC-like DNA-binding protein|nr:helix-turn-helix domain-containing protein [Cyclobacteriaceae bacterium]